MNEYLTILYDGLFQESSAVTISTIKQEFTQTVQHTFDKFLDRMSMGVECMRYYKDVHKDEYQLPLPIN